jgi:MFS family permease
MTGVRLTKYGFLVTTNLFFYFISWYAVFSIYVLRHVVNSSAETYSLVYTYFNFIIAITLLLSSFFIHRFNKVRIISISSLAISIVSIPLLFTSSIVLRLTIIFVAGVFFGIGQLAGFTYFWGLTVSEERGRAAGLGGFFALPIYCIVTWMAETFDFTGSVMLAVILSLETLVIILLTEKKAMLTTKKDEKEWHPEKRSILLYAVPWALFSLINATLARNISLHVSQLVPFSYYMVLVVLQVVAAVFGALSLGMIADFFGRRLPLVFGLTLYGIASALAGLVKNYDMFVFVYVANGLTWGIFLTLYFVVVWGDLSNKESCAKIYSIGLIIYYSAAGVGSLLTNQISQIPLVISSLVSCLLIFLSNIPLILAPELLSPDFREKIRLKLHINAIRKIGRKPSQNQG